MSCYSSSPCLNTLPILATRVFPSCDTKFITAVHIQLKLSISARSSFSALMANYRSGNCFFFFLLPDMHVVFCSPQFCVIRLCQSFGTPCLRLANWNQTDSVLVKNFVQCLLTLWILLDNFHGVDGCTLILALPLLEHAAQRGVISIFQRNKA